MGKAEQLGLVSELDRLIGAVGAGTQPDPKPQKK